MINRDLEDEILAFLHGCARIGAIHHTHGGFAVSDMEYVHGTVGSWPQYSAQTGLAIALDQLISERSIEWCSEHGASREIPTGILRITKAGLRFVRPDD